MLALAELYEELGSLTSGTLMWPVLFGAHLKADNSPLKNNLRAKSLRKFATNCATFTDEPALGDLNVSCYSCSSA
jgi:hypothetical protein